MHHVFISNPSNPLHSRNKVVIIYLLCIIIHSFVQYEILAYNMMYLFTIKSCCYMQTNAYAYAYIMLAIHLYVYTSHDSSISSDTQHPLCCDIDNEMHPISMVACTYYTPWPIHINMAPVCDLIMLPSHLRCN